MNILYGFLWVAGLYLLITFLLFFVYVFLSIKISASAKKFVRYSNTPTIAFFGDSTGYGVGASCPENSLPGIIASKNPQYTIINDSKNGAPIRNITSVLECQKIFDILFVCGTGIDILRLRKIKMVRSDIRDLFSTMVKKSKKPIFVTPLNLGFSSAFPWFLKKMFWEKSRKIGLLIEEEAKSFPEIILVNNLLEDGSNMQCKYDVVCCEDKIHPNDDGYKWVFEKIKQNVNIDEINL